jgi:hypothetical protein
MPDLKMPALTQFIDGTGPVWRAPVPVPVHHHRLRRGLRLPRADQLRHHAQDAGEREATRADRLRRHADGIVRRDHGAGRRLRARSGRVFRDEQPGRADRHDAAESPPQAISSWGFTITPEMLTQTAKDVGEHSIMSRTGGAPTLAVGMAHILHQVGGGKAMMAFWYHFAILFEALFILTAVDAGTRAARFMLQDLIGTFARSCAHRKPGRPTWSPPPCASPPGATSCIRAWSIRWAASTRCGRCSASPTRCWPASR